MNYTLNVFIIFSTFIKKKKKNELGHNLKIHDGSNCDSGFTLLRFVQQYYYYYFLIDLRLRRLRSLVW